MDDIATIHYSPDSIHMLTTEFGYDIWVSKDGKRMFRSCYSIRRFHLNATVPWHMMYEVLMPTGEKILCYMPDNHPDTLIELNAQRSDKLIAKRSFFGWKAVYA